MAGGGAQFKIPLRVLTPLNGVDGVGGGDAVRNSTSAGRKIFLLSPDAADDDGDGEGDGVMLLLMVVLMMVMACW